MSSDEDSQLRDLVSQTLESQGVLPRIRAELRASIFSSLEANNGKFKEKLKHNNVLNKLSSTSEGILALCVIKDFLECCNLDFTNNVFQSEIGVCNEQLNYNGRSKLLQDLTLNSKEEEEEDVPVLCQLIKKISSQSQASPEVQLRNEKNSDTVIKEKTAVLDLVNGTDENEFKVDHEERLKQNYVKNAKEMNLVELNSSNPPIESPPQLVLDLPPLTLNTKIKSATSIIKTMVDLDNEEIKPQIIKETSESPSHKKGGGDTGSEIEEDLDSVDDLLNSSGSLRDDVTRENSMSTLSSGIGDYMEDVSGKN